MWLLLSVSAFAGDWGKSPDATWDKAGAEVPVGKRLSVSAPVIVGDLAIYPVVDRDSTGRAESDVVPLSVAMSTGQVRVHESPNGQVDQLVLVNHGDSPVLLQAGDVVDGGNQDRVIQRSALIAGGGRPVAIPVQCVERGRWSSEGSLAFRYGGRVDPVLRDVVVRAASQDATWAAVGAANRARGVNDAASWLAGRSLDPRALASAEAELKHRFEDDKRVVGVVVARGGRFTSAELYADPTLFAQDRLVVLGSHLSAPAGSSVARVPSLADAAAFLEGELAE
jgi:hypothetical protein